MLAYMYMIMNCTSCMYVHVLYMYTVDSMTHTMYTYMYMYMYVCMLRIIWIPCLKTHTQTHIFIHCMYIVYNQTRTQIPTCIHIHVHVIYVHNHTHYTYSTYTNMPHLMTLFHCPPESSLVRVQVFSQLVPTLHHLSLAMLNGLALWVWLAHQLRLHGHHTTNLLRLECRQPRLKCLLQYYCIIL